MKKQCLWLVIGFFSFGTLPSYAGSIRDILKALYEAGSSAAVAEDFPKRDFFTGKIITSVNRNCVIVDSYDRPFNDSVSRVERVLPPAGPLVPGKTEEKLVFGDIGLSFNLMEEAKTVGVDLVLNNPIYRTWIDGTNGTTHFVPAQMYARRAGDYIAYRVFIRHDISGFRDEEYFGYCFPTDSKPLF